MTPVLNPNVTAVEIVRLLTATPDVTFDRDQLNAIGAALRHHFIVITDNALAPALADGIVYCATCITGCAHGCGPASCEHAGCWGDEATNSCAGIRFERLALPIMQDSDWVTAEAR